MWLVEGRMLRKPAWVARHVPPIPFILMGGESGSIGGSGASGSMTTGERLDKLDKELNETRAKVCFCCADTLFTPPILNISLFFRSTSLPTR